MQNKRTILFGITGDSLSMDATAAMRLLMRDGWDIQVMLTAYARRFVSEKELSQLTGNPVVCDMFTQPPRCTVDHIELARAASCFVVAPATAQYVHSLALGLADDMLLTTALAVTAPVVLYPAPGCDAQDLAELRLLGYIIVEMEYLESPRNAIYRTVSQRMKLSGKLEAVVCDLDGSLLDSGKHIHPDDLAAIARLKKKGVRFFVSTGRHFDLAKQTVSAVGFDYPVSACNGAHIYDYLTGRTLYASKAMPKRIVDGMLDYLSEKQISFLVYTTEMVVFDSRESKRSLYWKEQLEKFDESNRFQMRFLGEEGVDLHNSHVLKFLLAYVDDEIKREVESRFNQKNELSILYSAKNLLDINVAGSSKGIGVEKLANFFRFSLEDTLILGDSENDLSMLKICGMPVAPANGEAKVKRIAKYVTTDNDSAPLSHALEELYPELMS